MIEIGKTLVSTEILEKKFVCDLQACKGACCIEGDAGAPLEKEEAELLKQEYENIKPFMRAEGIAAIEDQGTNVIDDWDGELVTPLINGAECAYVQFNDKGIATCAIEEAFIAGATTFQKPVSCHLYPVRITKYKKFDAVNYHEWHVCEPACSCGDKLDVPVFRFLKNALIRKYGEEWFKQVEEAFQLAQNLKK